MRFAYLTRDEVNQELALVIAAQHGVDLDVYARLDAVVQGNPDAVLCDLDSFPAEERKANFVVLASGPTNQPLAVYGYNLDDQQRELLHRSGVLTARSLQRTLWSRLLAAIRQRRRTHTVA